MRVCVCAVELMQHLWEPPACDVIVWHPRGGRSERMRKKNLREVFKNRSVNVVVI